jgi:hypothetical protein
LKAKCCTGLSTGISQTEKHRWYMSNWDPWTDPEKH